MHIRPLDSWEEYRACERLQREVWGSDFREVAPASLLKVARRLGGVASGAFADGDEGEEMAGFVFGLTGFEDGRPVHWSHMLAVREERRGQGIGRRLKEHQRRRLLGIGVRTVYWTFDPLVATNAHFNLNRLGVRVVDYVARMYGETESELHRGIGTDRFIVAWDLEEYEPAGQPTASQLREDPEVAAAGEPPADRIEIPSDVLEVRRRDPAEAAAWRQRTREAFLSRLGSGYRVTGFVPGPERGHYLLARPDVDEQAIAGGP